jgi:hypothetical protein
LAELIGTYSGRPPLLILLDGGVCDFACVAREYQQILAQVAPVGKTLRAEMPDWLDPVALDERPGQIVSQMERELTELATAAIEADGIDAEDAELVADALVLGYVDWLTHLVAGAGATFPAWGGSALHVVSTEFVDPAADWPGATATTLVRCDCAHADLLRDPRAGAVVRERIGVLRDAAIVAARSDDGVPSIPDDQSFSESSSDSWRTQ